MKLSSNLLIILSLLTFQATMNAENSVIAGQPGHEGYLNSQPTKSLFENPNGIVLLPDDSLLIADSGNFRIRLLQKDQVKTFAGSGKQSRKDSGNPHEAAFAGPDCVELLPDGTILVGDSSRVRKIDNNGVVSTWADLLETIPGSPAHITDILSTDNNLYICDRINRRIYAKKGTDAPTIVYTCEKEPHSLALRPNGDILIG